MKPHSLRFRKAASLSCLLLICQHSLFVPLLAAQDGLGVVNSDGIPNGASVVAGSANIQINGNNLNVNSISDRTIINWNNFSVGSGNSVNFNQPGLNSAVLNRVISANPSAINGIINSNGNVMLVNPNGIVIGSGGVINTNGFTASVFDISNEDFLNGGDLTFSGNSNASVINTGSIFTGNGGVHLLGNTVINSGLIESSGNINLLSGGTVKLENGVTYTQADAATIQNGISETAGLIRNSGTLRATGSMEVGGEVYLVAPGGKVFNEGMVAASKSDVGGKVVVTGKDVELNNATIDVSGQNGGGQVNIGGGFQGNDPSILNATTTSVDENTSIIADALVSGNGGEVIVWSNASTDFSGSISSQGGLQSGNGGLVEVSGMSLAFNGQVNTTAANGDTGWLLLDPVGIRIVSGPPSRFSPGTDPVLTVTDGMLNNLLNFNSILLATSSVNTDILPAGGIPSGRGFGGLNDDNIVVSAGTTINTGSNTLYFSTSTVDLYAPIIGNISGGGSSGTTLFPPIGPVKDPTVVNVFGSASGGAGSIQNGLDLLNSGGTLNLKAGTYSSFVVNRPNIIINGDGPSTIIQTASPAITIAANNTTVMNMNLTGTGSAGDIGILLDGIASPGLNGISIDNVTIDNMEDGIVAQGVIGNGGATDVSIDGVTITNVTRDGIRFPSVDRATIEILNSDIGTSASRAGDDGISIENLDAAAGQSPVVTLDGNNVFAADKAIQVGNLVRGGVLNINGGSYDGTLGGLEVINSGFNPNGFANIGAANFTGGGISNVVHFATAGPPLSGVNISFLGGTTISNGGTGLLINGPRQNIDGDTLGNTAFVGQSVNYIHLANGAEFLPGTPTVIDANSVTFDGLLASDMTVSQLFATEDMILHFPDNPTLGLIDISTLFVLPGESIQTAVNFARTLAGPQTIAVADGVYGGSVEVWVDNLTLRGEGPRTVINTNGVDPFANNGDVNAGFEVTNRPGGGNGIGDVTGVTIDGFGFTSLTLGPANAGVVLGHPAGSAVNTTIQNSGFANLQGGVRGRFVEGTTTLSNLSMTNISQQGVRFANSLNSATVLIENSNIVAGVNAVRFAAPVVNSDVTISGNTLVSTGDDAITFLSPIANSSVFIGGAGTNVIAGFDDGINVDEIFASDFTVQDTDVIAGQGGSGIEFEGTIGGSSDVQITGNTNINGGEEGIEFDTDIIGSNVGISGNTSIVGVNDGIQFKEAIGLSSINIDGNLVITGNSGNGIVFEDSIGASLLFVGNNLGIIGLGERGIAFEDTIDLSGILLLNNNIDSTNSDAVRFADDINLSGIGVVANRLRAIDDGIEIDGDVSESLVGILGNQLFIDGDGIEFNGSGTTEIDDSLVFIIGNTIGGQILIGTPSRGIEFDRIAGDSTVIVRANNIFETTSDGIIVQRAVTDNALLSIRGNTIGTQANPLGGDGIDIDRVNSARGVQILENDIFASSDAIEFDSVISNTNILVLDNSNLVGGANGIRIQNDVTGTTNFVVDNNVIKGINGIHMDNPSEIDDDVSFSVTNNIIDAMNGGSGIRLVNIGSSKTVLIDGNEITGGNFGINIIQRSNAGNNGKVEIKNTLITDATNTGIRIRNNHASNSLATTLQENVTVTGGNIGMVFDGPGLGLTGNTLGNTNFIATLGNFIELRNGALFEPGQPTLIDATGVNFDGIDRNTIIGFGQIEARVVHFIDDPTLGLFWPGFEPLNDLTYDQFERHVDLFETIQDLIGSGYDGTMNYGGGANPPNSNEFRGGTIQEQKANSYDVFGGQ